MIKRLTTAQEVNNFPFPDWIKLLYPVIISHEDVAILVSDDSLSGVVAEIHRGPTMQKLFIVWMQCNPEDKNVGLEFHEKIVEWGKSRGCRSMSFVSTREEVLGMMEKYKFTCIRTETEISKAI